MPLQPTSLVPHPGRSEYENQVGPRIIQELVVCLEDVEWFVVERALAP